MDSRLPNGCTVYLVDPVLDSSVRALCLRPYPGHPKGCPNFGKKEGCPPGAPRFDWYFDMTQPVFGVVHEFDLAGHVDRMRSAHPSWSDRQLRCVRFWQSTARKAWKAGVNEFLGSHPGYSATACPEAMGVNITETMRRIGVDLEWPPEKVARQVALCGVEIGGRRVWTGNRDEEEAFRDGK